MALITKLREKMGRVIVFAVGIAIMSFVLADLTSNQSFLTGGGIPDTDVGEIAGTEITQERFLEELAIVETEFTNNFRRSPQEAEMFTLREQAWDALILKIAFKREFDRIGLDISNEEMNDIVYGNNIDPMFLNAPAFQDPQTGEFSREALIQFVNNPNLLGEGFKAYWEQIVIPSLYQSRLRIKYENLMIKSHYVTEEEAKNSYRLQNQSVDIKYLYVPWKAVTDSLEITDEMLQSYLDDHGDEFEVENTRSLSYIRFSITPSETDSAEIMDEMNNLKIQFEQVTDDSLFAASQTDGRNFFNKYHNGTLPENLSSRIEGLNDGAIIGPYLEGEFYKLHKVSRIYEDSIYNARASHILIRWDDETDEAKAEARSEAQGILDDIKGGADFAFMATQYGTDNTKNTGGDLGWFPEGQMVDEFNDAVFDYRGTGLINQLIETRFGYHIIEVTEPKTNITYDVATIEREITASQETLDEAFERAGRFAARSVNINEFVSNGEADSLEIVDVENIAKFDRSMQGLGNSREIVRWLFNDAKTGQVSDVFQLDSEYVVAAMTGEVEEGVANLDDVRIQISVRLENELKADIIKEKLTGLQGTLEEIAETYGSDVEVFETSDLRPNSSSLPNVGFEPVVVGAAFGLSEVGDLTSPIAGENGVLVIELTNKSELNDLPDYSIYKDQLTNNLTNRTSYFLQQFIEESADIKDSRYKIY